MDGLLQAITDIIERFGITTSSIGMAAVVAVLLLCLYGVFRLTEHMQHSPLTEVFQYGRYEVTVENQTTHDKQVIVVTAINRISAVEKAAKRVQDIYNTTFTSKKL